MIKFDFILHCIYAIVLKGSFAMSHFNSNEKNVLQFPNPELKQLFQHMNNPIVIYELDQSKKNAKFIQINEATCNITGYTEDQLLNLSPATLFGDRDGFFQYQTELVKEKRLVTENFIHTTKSKLLPIEINAQIIANRNNKYIILAFIRDVSKRKHVATMLVKRTKQFESLFYYNPNIIFTLNAAGEFASMNPAGFELLQYEKNELIGTHYQILVDKEDIAHTNQQFKKIISGYSTQFEQITWSKLGDRYELQITAVPIIIEEKITGVIGIAQDITCENRTKQLLEESQQRYKSLFDNNIDMVASFDMEENLTDVNQATEDMTGYKKSQLIGKKFSQLCAENEQDRVKLLLENASDGQPMRFETSIMHKEGSIIHIHITVIPIVIDEKIIGMHCIIKNTTEHKKLTDQLNYIAYHDHLTALPNQRSFEVDFDQVIAHASKMKDKFAIIFLDLDRFKVINDSLGRSQGDSLLKKVAKRLKSVRTEKITAYRYGGDEFILLIQETNQHALKHFAEKLLNLLVTPYQMDGLEIVSTPSMGISIYPDDGVNKSTLIKNADNAMYHAKRIGKSNFQFYQEQLPKKVYGDTELETLLRKAIDREEFFLVYQPQINAITGHIDGVEALIRWENNIYGLVDPNDFIPLAEETGLIIPIGEWVLRNACSQAKQWQVDGMKPFSVSVNLSIRQFYQDNLPTVIEDILTKTELDPQYLVLEITESMAMDSTIASNVLQQLKNIGVKISIDDFGTGYSSLNYLKKFPIDYLKIDQSFVQDLSTDKDDREIIESIIMLGKKLGIGLIAEGVETADHVDFLKNLACNVLQGYYYSKPIAAEQVPGFIQESAFSND